MTDHSNSPPQSSTYSWSREVEIEINFTCWISRYNLYIKLDIWISKISHFTLNSWIYLDTRHSKRFHIIQDISSHLNSPSEIFVVRHARYEIYFKDTCLSDCRFVEPTSLHFEKWAKYLRQKSGLANKVVGAVMACTKRTAVHITSTFPHFQKTWQNIGENLVLLK